MNNLKFLLLGTGLSFIPLTINAQCVATQDCATLGYTETSCNGSKGVKCPFGNKWACLGANEKEYEKSFCNKYGFTLTCTGTGYTGGASSVCNGKYNYCNCTNGYEWKNKSCQKKEVLTGPDGDVYKCNGKIVAINTSEMNFYVAIKELGTMFWDEANDSCQNYTFCCDVKGSLPTRDQLLTMYNNKSSLNNLLTTNGGKTFEKNYYWTSTRDLNNDGAYYHVNMGGGYIFSSGKSHYSYVRPVLTSW